eukprot:jgi/Picre1/33941/NNA_001419.t1
MRNLSVVKMFGTVLLFLAALKLVSSQAGETFKLYGDFAPLQVPKTQGCPLAGVWTLGSDYPLGNVEGPLEGTQVKFSEPSSCSKEEFDAIAQKVLQDFDSGAVGAAESNRNIFHAAGTYSAVAGPNALGGVNGGWIRFQKNLDFAENAGLQGAVAYLGDLVKEYPCITFADAIVFTGVILTEATGGPAVAFMPGRRDADKTPQNPLIAARLPDATFTSSGVVYYYTQMGLTDREIAAINGGGHTLEEQVQVILAGMAALLNLVTNGRLQTIFISNKHLKISGCHRSTNQNSDKAIRIQYVLVDQNNEPVLSESGKYIIRIPSDVAILLDGRSPTAWAYSYYKDENLFMTDYTRTLQRISQLGNGDWSLNRTQYEWLGINGTATNYGVDIEPLAGESPVPEKDIIYPQWVTELRQKTGPLFTLVGDESQAPSQVPQTSDAFFLGIANVLAALMVCLF